MRIRILLLVVAVGSILMVLRSPAPAQDAPATRAATRPAMQFEQYQLVILRAGENAQLLPREELMDIQRQHLAHMRRLGEQGKILVAGPFSDQADKSMRGMCIYRCESIEEARQLAEADPAVKAERLRVDVLTWNVEKGYMAFPKAPAASDAPEEK